MSFINELLSLSNTDINFKQYIINKDLSIYQDGVITLEHFTDIMKKNINYFEWYNDIKKNNKPNKKIIPESKYLFNDNVNSKSALKLDLLQLPLLVNSYHQGEAHQQASNTDVPQAPPAPVQNTDVPQAPPAPVQKADIPLAPLAPKVEILKDQPQKNARQLLNDEIKNPPKLKQQQKIQQAPKNIPNDAILQLNKLKKVGTQQQKEINDLKNDIDNKIENLKQLENNDDWDKDDDDDGNDNEKKIKELTNKVNELQKEFYEKQLTNLKEQYLNLFSNKKLSLNNILNQYKETIIQNINNYLNKVFQYQDILNNIEQYKSDDLLDIKQRYENTKTYIVDLYKNDDCTIDNNYINTIFKDMILIIVPTLLCFKYKIQEKNKQLNENNKNLIENNEKLNKNNKKLIEDNKKLIEDNKKLIENNEGFVTLIEDISKNYINCIHKLIQKKYFTDINSYSDINYVFNTLYKFIDYMSLNLDNTSILNTSYYVAFSKKLLMNDRRTAVRYGGNNNLNKYINNIITLLNDNEDVDLTIFNLYNMLQINYLLALRLIEKTINCDIIKNNILYQKITEEEINNYIKNNYICFNFNNTVNIQQNMLFKDINCKHCIDIDNIVNNIIYGKYFIKKIKDDDFTYDNFINLISNYSNYKHILLILNESSLKSLFNLVKKFVKYITDNKINYVNSSLINFSYFVKNIIDKFINSDINSNDDINTDIEDIKRLYYNNFIFENNYVICYIIWNKLKNIYKPRTKITSYEPKYIKHDISNMIKKQSNTIKYNNDNKINNFFINNKLQNNKVNVLFEINKMATMNGGNLNKDMYTTIYEQIFDNIQNKLKSHKIKINQNDIIKITNKINDIKQYEKELIKIFKIMAKYTSQHNLTKLKHTEINYDMMKNFDDKYNKLCNNRIVDKYNKLCNNHNIAIIDIINTFNKINNRISNIIN